MIFMQVLPDAIPTPEKVPKPHKKGRRKKARASDVSCTLPIASGSGTTMQLAQQLEGSDIEGHGPPSVVQPASEEPHVSSLEKDNTRLRAEVTKQSSVSHILNVENLCRKYSAGDTIACCITQNYTRIPNLPSLPGPND